MDANKLVLINLKYSSSSEPLKIIAFAQFAAKALFLGKEPLTMPEIKEKMAKLIGIPRVSEELVKKAVNHLLKEEKIKNEKGKYLLTQSYRKEIDNTVEKSHRLIMDVAKRHFPNSINEDKLELWFNAAATAFFGYYSDDWIKAICKNSSNNKFVKSRNVEEIITPIINQHSLYKYKDSLVAGFFEFISSDNSEDRQCLMNLGLAMFSSKLVVADVGVDPIPLEEIKKSKLILDTNFIIALSLERSRLSNISENLGKALKYIEANPVYLFETKKEYERVINGNKNNFLAVFRKYPEEVVSGAYNDFILTAKSRGCVSEEDYITFFDSISNLPENIFDNLSFVSEDDEKIQSVSEDAKKDEKIKKEIQRFRVILRPDRLKSEAALNHDSALLNVGKLIKERNEKFWIITMDRTLNACAINEAGPHGISPVITADALIQILALNNAGPDLDASNFAPLMSNILLNKCAPPANAYTLEDLQWLYGINERVVDFPPDKIKDLVKIVTKARLEGKSQDDKDLQLKVNRAFQEKKMEIAKEIEEAKENALNERRNSEEEKKKKELAKQALVKYRKKDLKFAALKKLIKKTLIRLLVTLLIAYVAYKIGNYIPQTEKYAYVFALLPIGWSIFSWIKSPLATYELEVNNSEKEAGEEIEKRYN